MDSVIIISCLTSFHLYKYYIDTIFNIVFI